MKKRGFTLVELLAVISILAILVIVAMPNVLKMFKESKQKSFTTEVETIKNEINKEVLNSSLKNENPPPVISSVGDFQLDMDGRDLDYYAELNRDGSLKYLEVSDGEFYYQYSDGMTGTGEVIDFADKDEDVPSKIEYIKNNVATENIFVYTNTYNIYDETNSVPVIITNTSSNEIKIDIYYGNSKIGADYVVPGGAIDHVIFVKLAKSMVSSMSVGKSYPLKIEADINLGKDLEGKEDIIVKHSYANKVKVKRVNPGMIIKKVTSTSNNDKIAFNQSGIFVPRGVDIGILNVTVYDANLTKTYKFTNINRQALMPVEENKINNKKYFDVTITGEELLKYQAYLKNGEYIHPKDTYRFDMSFASQDYVQKIFFDFEEYINPGVYHNGNITIASKETFDTKSFGDFKLQDSSVAEQYHKESLCKKAVCFGTKGILEDVPTGELLLGANYGTLALKIAQSMSVQDSYSVYTTINGTTNQSGYPAGSFPATILAISEANTKYLSWIGIYEGYLQVYSYYEGTAKSGQRGDTTEPGFVSIPIGQYEGKVMNIQVTASRTGMTRVYINGNLIREFASGGDAVSYTIATIGDLRPSRGLKFTGSMYDVTLYNIELSSDAVAYNWNHAKNTWNIN